MDCVRVANFWRRPVGCRRSCLRWARDSVAGRRRACSRRSALRSSGGQRAGANAIVRRTQISSGLDSRSATCLRSGTRSRHPHECSDGETRPRISRLMYYSIVVDDSDFSISSGSLRPTDEFAVPLEYLKSIRVGRAPQGVRIRDSLSLVFHIEQIEYRLDLCLLRSIVPVPRTLSVTDLTALADQIQLRIADGGSPRGSSAGSN